MLLGMLALYLVLLGAAIWGLVETRSWVVATYSTPAEEKNWNEFRAAIEQRQNDPHSPVQRSSQRGDEPPIKILFTDNLPAVLLWALLFLSILYWSVGIMMVGALRTSNQPPAQRSPDTDV